MSMPRAVRHINEVRILNGLYRLEAATRADLARELGLMRSTVGNLVAGMIDQGLVSETAAIGPIGPVAARRSGRPGQFVKLNPAHSAFIGADIGVGHLSVVAVDLRGSVCESRTIVHEPASGDAEATIGALATLVRAVMKRLPRGQILQGICVTVPGLVDHEGVVLRAPLLRWNAVPVQRLLRAQLKFAGKLTSENDANAFAAAELYGRTTTVDTDALFVYLDAGVGAGMVVDGKLLRGHSGYAGEIGHIHLGERGFDQSAAMKGSFESYVGREAVLALYARHGGGAASLPGLLDAVSNGVPAALRTAEKWAWWLGRGLASLISVLDPGRIVLGGPVAGLYPCAERYVLDSISNHLVQPSPLPGIEVSALGPDACAIGGALLLHRAQLSIDERIVYGGANEAARRAPVKV
jgi:predicted NBD/HSP70 family sugar kinase